MKPRECALAKARERLCSFIRELKFLVPEYCPACEVKREVMRRGAKYGWVCCACNIDCPPDSEWEAPSVLKCGGCEHFFCEVCEKLLELGTPDECS